MPELPSFPVATMAVHPWPDVVIDGIGHDPRSDYVERFWLGVLGPSATWLVRRLAAGLELHPDGYELDLGATALELGLGTRSGKHSPFMRTIERCARFGAIDLTGADSMRVRRKLPPLTRYQQERLPQHLRDEHQRLLDAALSQPNPHEVRERARGVALSFAARGFDAPAIERELHERSIHPALAHEVAAWAVMRALEAPARQAGGPLPPAA